MADDTDERSAGQRWMDAILHQGPGYDLTPPRFTAHPVTPEMERAATERARQAAAASERSAAWFAKHSAPDARYDELQQQRDQLAADLRYALTDHGPRHNHLQPGIWDDTGKPCDHCARLDVARAHLAELATKETL